MFFGQFADLLVIILIFAALISMFSGNIESTIVILVVLVMNAVLGTLQYVKAQKSLDSLKQLSNPNAKVIREGRKQEIPSREIVPGDLVVLEAGDMVVADGRILHNYSLQVNESSLTGESNNVEKQDGILEADTALADRTNMVYAGSLVTYGRADVLVTATGMDTELGKIAGLMNAAKERKTPLQESLDAFSGRLAIFILLICVLVFGLCLYRNMAILDALMFAVALAVAAIPEALDIEDKAQQYVLYDALLTNDSSIVDGKGIGDPTEYALLEMFDRIPKHSGIKTDRQRLEEIPFDSMRKLMTTKYRIDGHSTILTKGAVDVLLECCVSVQYGNQIVAMTESEKAKIKAQNQAFSQQGLRVLAFAYKESGATLDLDAEYGFTFLGLISMVDPPRKESVQAVADAKKAGIKPIMITGDHKLTAIVIAQTIGIYEPGDLALTGVELDAMTDTELDAKITQISVYARVSPENKIRIVEAWQRKGHIVSMTGDGVNDAPALKKADIGVAMGITGTEVSKDAAAMILSDDNFATIIKAVANGRNVYRNIKNAILFLLSGNTAGILAVLYASLVGLPMPFAPVHLLFINLLTDSLPALAIGMEPASKNLLLEEPRDPKAGILTKAFVGKMFVQGGLIALVTMMAYSIGLHESAMLASTMAFATLTLARLFHGFNCRDKQSIFQLGLFSNKYSIYAFVAGTLLLALVLFVPALHSLFSVATISPINYAWIVLLAFLPTACIQLVKWMQAK